jgi:hypothetical protein
MLFHEQTFSPFSQMGFVQLAEHPCVTNTRLAKSQRPKTKQRKRKETKKLISKKITNISLE